MGLHGEFSGRRCQGICSRKTAKRTKTLNQPIFLFGWVWRGAVFQVGGVGGLPQTRRRVVADQDYSDGQKQRENDGRVNSGHIHAGSQGGVRGSV